MCSKSWRSSSNYLPRAKSTMSTSNSSVNISFSHFFFNSLSNWRRSDLFSISMELAGHTRLIVWKPQIRKQTKDGFSKSYSPKKFMTLHHETVADHWWELLCPPYPITFFTPTWCTQIILLFLPECFCGVRGQFFQEELETGPTLRYWRLSAREGLTAEVSS